jgi:hypothetical protein
MDFFGDFYLVNRADQFLQSTSGEVSRNSDHRTLPFWAHPQRTRDHGTKLPILEAINWSTTNGIIVRFQRSWWCFSS